jgi:bacteriorhodopsin
MSTWGVWGYWGVVIGLVAMLTVFFVAMKILFPARKTEEQNEASAGQREPATTGSRHAA